MVEKIKSEMKRRQSCLVFIDLVKQVGFKDLNYNRETHDNFGKRSQLVLQRIT